MGGRSYLKSIATSILILTFLAVSASAGPGDAAVKQVQQLKDKGDYSGALAAAASGLALEPDNLKLNTLKGDIFLAQAVYDSSLIYYQKALQKKGKDPDALYGAGMAAYNLKQYDEALNYMQQADKTGKLKAKALYGMGLVQMEKGDYQNADLSFRKAIDKDKKNPTYHLALGEVNFRNKTYPIAISEFSKAVDLDSSLFSQKEDLHYKLAVSYLNMRNIPKAIEEYKIDVQLHPTDTTAWMELARIYDISGNTAEAVYCYEKYLAISTNNGQAWYDLGHLYLKIPDQEKAAGAFETAVRLETNVAESFGQLAKIYSDRKEFDRAFDAYNRYEAAFGAPDSAEYWFEKGKVLMKMGERNPAYFDTALVAFDRTLSVDPTYSAAYEYAGLTQYYQKNYPEAINYFLRKVEMDSTSINTYRNLAFSYLKTEQYGQAAKTFARALELKPDDVMMRSLLAKIYSVNKDYKNSIAQYERILNGNGNGSPEVSDSLRCEIYPDLGAGYLQDGNHQAAVTTLLKAERCQPNDFSILMNIASAYLHLDKVSEAHTYYGKALDIKPNDKEAKKGFMMTQIQGKE